MWVEPDTNMPTGESFVRQLLYGQRYFERTFGARHTVCWLPDCFGFSPALPQLLTRRGHRQLLHHQGQLVGDQRFPYDLFWWEGLDGSRVLAHTFDNPVGGYNGESGPRAALETWRNFRGKTPRPRACSPSATATAAAARPQEMLERASGSFATSPSMPARASTNVDDVLRRAPRRARRRELPVWVGEMYLELHRGTLTTQGRHQVPASPRRARADHRRGGRVGLNQPGDLGNAVLSGCGSDAQAITARALPAASS